MKWLVKENKHQSTYSLEQHQAETLAAMGTHLSTLRREKGLSLEEMVILTKVPRRLLQAIEEGDMQQLPEPVYIQGLIRQYADALGLKGAEFASQFPVGINKITIQPVTNTTPLSQLRPIHLYLIYIFVILCAAIGLSELLKADTFKTASTDLTQEQPQTTSDVKKNLQPVSETTTSNQGQQVQIGITLTKKSWIQVIVDGKIEYEGELPQGFSRTWKAQEMLTVKTDDAGGVLVSINHQKAKQLGEPGKQKEVTIAANTRP